jgi:hypothetical protein
MMELTSVLIVLQGLSQCVLDGLRSLRMGGSSSQEEEVSHPLDPPQASMMSQGGECQTEDPAYCLWT